MSERQSPAPVKPTQVGPNPVGIYFPHDTRHLSNPADAKSEPATICVMWLAEQGGLVLGVVTADCTEGEAHVLLIVQGEQAQMLAAQIAAAVSSSEDSWTPARAEGHHV